MNSKISIVVPVYNTKNHLMKLINSVIHQTMHENVELILVDDASTDGTFEDDEIKQIIHQSDNIKILKNPINRGPSYTRNKGVREATGEYIIFADSDDYLNYELIEKICKCIDSFQDKVDVIRYQLQVENDSKKEKNPLRFNVPSHSDLLKGEDAAVKWSKLDKMWLIPTCFALNREWFLNNNLFFPEMKIYEDVAIVCSWILNAESVAALDYIGYFYVRREGSITRPTSEVGTEKNILNLITACYYALKGICDNDKISNTTKRILCNYYYKDLDGRVSELDYQVKQLNFEELGDIRNLISDFIS